MADGVSFDFSEINALAANLDAAPGKMGRNLIAAVEVTAHNVRDDWRESWQGSEHVPAGAGSITYDLLSAASAILGRSAVSAEIGPEVGRPAGPLVGMLEYGTPNTGARGYGAEALHKNEQDFVDGVQKAGDVL